LVKIGESTAEEAGKKIGVSAWEQAKALWDKLRPRVEAKSAAQEAVQDMIRTPNDEDARTVLRVQLKKLLAEDETLLKEITQLMEAKSKTTMASTVINQQAGDSTTQIGQVDGDVNIVRAGPGGIAAGRDIYMSPDERRARAERKTDEGRKKVQEWGERINQFGWGEQAWHLLGFALQFTHEAVEVDPDYQRAWTLMADVYHRIGKEELARKCLKKSYSLAGPGPNFPGRFYKQVDKNIKSGYPFNSAGRLQRQSPPTWFEAKYQRYWTI
jgi:tetratricopeptide (TPR) repeat protein